MTTTEGRLSTVDVVWPADGHDAWWASADRFARGHAGQASWLDSMHGLGWASLCADTERGGQGQPVSVLCRVLEAVSAVHASAAAAVYASAAAHLALNLGEWSVERKRLLHDLSVDWLAWPAFHDIDEQLWPSVDAQGYLRGQVDMLLGGAHAQWAVLPAQLRDQSLGMVLVDLRHPAVIRGQAVTTLGLPASGINDVEFGGVPCELVSTQGRALFMALAGALASAVLAMQCGVARASLAAATHHTQTRHQGGGPLIGWGEVRRLLSLMHERLRVIQGLLHTALSTQACALKNVQTHDAGVASSARYAVLHAGQLACELASDGVQLFGGVGYERSAPQSGRLCDVHQLKCLMGSVAWRRQRLIDEALEGASDSAFSC